MLWLVQYKTPQALYPRLPVRPELTDLQSLIFLYLPVVRLSLSMPVSVCRTAITHGFKLALSYLQISLAALLYILAYSDLVKGHHMHFQTQNRKEGLKEASEDHHFTTLNRI